jgi:lysozyme family protein
MSDAIDNLITNVIEREGGYVNHASDRGGPTNWGITQGTLAASRGRPVSIADVQALTQAEARKIYRANYFAGLDDVTDPKVLEFLFDYAVNSGPRRAVKALQTVIGVTADGAFGPASKAALAKVKQADLYGPLICERLDFYLRIIANDPSQVVFAAGWANRIKPFWERKAA